MRSLAVVFALLLSVGCSSDGSSPLGDDDDDDGAEPALTIGIEPWEVGPVVDQHWCKTMKVPGDASVTWDVSRIEITMTPGSHHFILYRTDADLPDGFGACTEMDRTFITGSQTTVAETVFPAGKAMPLFGGEQLILESHYANASTEAITAEVTVDFFTIPHEQVEDYLQTILVPWTEFEIPPATFGYSESMTVPEFSGYNTWQLSSHMHHRGTRFTADRILPGAAAPERIYESTDWSSPAVSTFDPPIAWDSANSVRFECTWDNETDQPIHHGPTTDDEMCILVVTFFPAYSYSP